MNRIKVRYRSPCLADQADGLAKAIAWEQTVEVVETVVRSDYIRREIVGQVESISHQDGIADMEISYSPQLAGEQLGQLFNLVYGNISMYPNLRLESLEVPDFLAQALGGPGFGVAGIRQHTGVHNRPLLCTVIKPKGTAAEELADLAYRYALGGGDLIKDDQNLVESDFADFCDRISRCHQAIEQANQKTGKQCLYFAHVSGAGDALEQRLDYVRRLGIPGVLLCPMIMGLETCKAAVKRHKLMYMAHPAMSGVWTMPEQHGIAGSVLFGAFYRLGGADITIYPGPGGRISLPEQEQGRVVDDLSKPMGGIPASLAAPAGGKSLEQIPDYLQRYGQDMVFLTGGALLSHSSNLTDSTAVYIEALSTKATGDQ